MTMNLEKTKCIVCSAETTIIKELPKEMIGKMLSQRGILDSISELGVVDGFVAQSQSAELVASRHE